MGTRAKWVVAVALLVFGPLFLLSIPTSAFAQTCYTAAILEPTPFNGNGGEIIVLNDGTIWEETSYQYLYLYEYNPTVIICPREGKMILGRHLFYVIRAQGCYKAVILEPTPFNGNGGEIIVLNDGTIWKETSYQYLYLYEYNPTVIFCPKKGKMVLAAHVFYVIPVGRRSTN